MSIAKKNAPRAHLHDCFTFGRARKHYAKQSEQLAGETCKYAPKRNGPSIGFLTQFRGSRKARKTSVFHHEGH
jgi:hypothetical protein